MLAEEARIVIANGSPLMFQEVAVKVPVSENSRVPWVVVPYQKLPNGEPSAPR